MHVTSFLFKFYGYMFISLKVINALQKKKKKKKGMRKSKQKYLL